VYGPETDKVDYRALVYCHVKVITRRCMYKVTLKRVRVTIAAVKKAENVTYSESISLTLVNLAY
jgi:hypothetical protein